MHCCPAHDSHSNIIRKPDYVSELLQIPVFRGATKALLGQTVGAGDFHGKDGLGDAPDPDAPGLELVQKEGAVSAMIRIVNENPGEVYMIIQYEKLINGITCYV